MSHGSGPYIPGTHNRRVPALDTRLARPTGLTPAVAKRLAEAFRKGLSVRGACGMAGIGTCTYSDWMRRGKAGELKYAEFSALMAKAKAEIEVEAVQAWTNAFKDDWRAAAKFLEYRKPERWGKRPAPQKDDGRISAEAILREMLKDTPE